jgi:ATP-dependent Clp protease ATP-binding subunit ClpX
MFELDGFALDFEHDALVAIADKAIERNTGARGLRAILEEILGPIMFELPGSPITGTVIITKSVVLTGEIPTVVPFNTVREKSA